MFNVNEKLSAFGRAARQGKIKYHTASGSSGFSRLVVVPLTLLGAVVSTLAFSVFFVLLLVPISVVAYGLWKQFKNLANKEGEVGECLDGEYTVINNKPKK